MFGRGGTGWRMPRGGLGREREPGWIVLVWSADVRRGREEGLGMGWDGGVWLSEKLFLALTRFRKKKARHYGSVVFVSLLIHTCVVRYQIYQIRH